MKEHFADPEVMRPASEHAKLAGYFNDDNGTGKIRGVYLQENTLVAPIFRKWMEPLRDLGVTTIAPGNTGGTVIGPGNKTSGTVTIKNNTLPSRRGQACGGGEPPRPGLRRPGDRPPGPGARQPAPTRVPGPRRLPGDPGAGRWSAPKLASQFPQLRFHAA